MKLFLWIYATSCMAQTTTLFSSHQTKLWLHQQPGFFHFSYDNINMPSHFHNMGLLGINYFSDITPSIYGGVGGYAAITGKQGGFFVLGMEGGFHYELFPHWSGVAGLFVGGGGGRSTPVGGGLMLRPQIGLQYSWPNLRLGLHYSYIDFPNGRIHSDQVGLDLDVPYDFYYVCPEYQTNTLFKLNEIFLANGQYLVVKLNDFAIVLQAYQPQSQTKNVYGQIQDDSIGLVGAEWDHYFTNQAFWYIKLAGAFHGTPNGYMDLLGGLGLHRQINSSPFAIVPQIGIGAAGGGYVNTGGGLIMQPQVGVEAALNKKLAVRLSGGYLRSLQGSFKAYTATTELIYHLDFAAGENTLSDHLPLDYKIQNWRLQIFNQTYLHPQRIKSPITSSVNLIGFQADQFVTPYFFISYQAASSYRGDRSGGYATGMIGPGMQTREYANLHLQFFTELLAGAGGGGLAVGRGAILEPVAGIHLTLTKIFGLQTSVSYIKSLHDNLSTPAINLGMTLRLGVLS